MRSLFLLAALPVILAGCLESSSSVVAPSEPTEPDYSTVPAPHPTNPDRVLGLALRENAWCDIAGPVEKYEI